MPGNVVGGDALPEVGLEGVDALVHQVLEFADVPLAGGWVGEVDESHARLPQIPLPDAAVRALEEVSGLRGFGEEGLPLRYIVIDPR